MRFLICDEILFLAKSHFLVSLYISFYHYLNFFSIIYSLLLTGKFLSSTRDINIIIINIILIFYSGNIILILLEAIVLNWSYIFQFYFSLDFSWFSYMFALYRTQFFLPLHFLYQHMSNIANILLYCSSATDK